MANKPNEDFQKETLIFYGLNNRGDGGMMKVFSKTLSNNLKINIYLAKN